MFSKEALSKIKSIFDSVTDEEFEFMFNNYKIDNALSQTKYTQLLKYLSVLNSTLSKGKKQVYIKKTQLDIAYNHSKDNLSNYRITIDGIDAINKYMNSIVNRKNHLIFSLLTSMAKKGEKDISIMKKTKDKSRTFDVNDLDIRVRVSKEENVATKELDKLTNVSEDDRLNIFFRYKQRGTIVLMDTKEVKVVIDLTLVTSNQNIKFVKTSPPRYEIELEVTKKSKKVSIDTMKKIIEEVTRIKQVLQQSKYIVTNTVRDKVLDSYKKIIYGENEVRENRFLFRTKPESLQIQHVTDKLPTRYTVTDKADGEGYFLIIFDGKVYFINGNLEVKDSGLSSDKFKAYNGTIIDGEYIFMRKYRKFVFMSFDILSYKGENITREPLLENRFKKLDDVLKKCFGDKFNFDKFSDSFSLDKASKYYEKQCKDHLDDLNKSLKESKDLNIIKRKLFIFPTGGHDCEIFTYSSIMWKVYVKSGICPYSLDGLMYTPYNQIYSAIDREVQHKTYKWKPPSHNSIDFYVEFARDEKTGKIISAFDNSGFDEDGDIDESIVKNKVYKICKLFNGKFKNGKEIPIPFKEREGLNVANLYLDDKGFVRDQDGNIIQDKTVVEFYYDDNNNIPLSNRWKPMRTRFDKTEAVVRYKRKYGNNSVIAAKIWASIKNPFVIDDINMLGQPDKYLEYLDTIKRKITTKIIETSKADDRYYQHQSKLGKYMRNYHNYIKSNLIGAYCSPYQVEQTSKTQRIKVLDVGCGRGGDIQKFQFANTDSVVGIEPNYANLYDATDGAISRFKNHKRKNTYIPQNYYIVADAGIKLTVQDQLKAIGKTNEQNETLLRKYFGETVKDKPMQKYDVFNCQFMIHYLLKDETTWNNFIWNVNNLLEDGGYLIMTTYDGEIVDKGFNKDGKLNSFYVTEEGTKSLFFECIKKYKSKNLNKLGLPIDVHVASFMDAGQYVTEYLVTKDFLVKEMKEKCNTILIETDMFENLEKNSKKMLKTAGSNDSRTDTATYLSRVAEIYNKDDPIIRASMEMSRLNRYYIFMKR